MDERSDLRLTTSFLHVRSGLLLQQACWNSRDWLSLGQTPHLIILPLWSQVPPRPSLTLLSAPPCPKTEAAPSLPST